jgi:glycosyltransferase involved in cell wall biosynthesis
VHVAIVSTPFVPVPPPAYGGTELVLHHLVRGLRAEGARVTLFATGDSDGGDGGAAPVRWLYPRAIWPPAYDAEVEHTRFAVAEAAAERVDAIHVNSPLGLALSTEAGLPTVCTVHHAHEPRYSAVYATHGEESVLVAISGRQRAIDPALAPARVIHHGLDPRDYPASRTAGRDVAFIGRLTPAKGIHLGIDAALRAGRAIRIAGKVHPDPGADAYFERELAPRFGRPGVSWIGEVGGRGKRELLRAAAVLVMPVDWEEPFGLVLIEAMLSGTPVAAFSRGSIPEVVEDGLTGFLAEPGDVEGLARAIDRAARLDRGAVRARAVERWNHRKMARAYLEAYAEAPRVRAAAAARRRAAWAHRRAGGGAPDREVERA